MGRMISPGKITPDQNSAPPASWSNSPGKPGRDAGPPRSWQSAGQSADAPTRTAGPRTSPNKPENRKEGYTMGAINYGTSAIITLATRFQYADDFREEAQEEARETGETDIDAIISRMMEANEEADSENASFILRDFSAAFFRLAIAPGYYEGLQIVINDDRPREYDDAEREQARRDVDELEKALLALAGVGFTETWPGWCTTFRSYSETVETIRAEADKIREEIDTAPNWAPKEWTD